MRNRKRMFPSMLLSQYMFYVRSARALAPLEPSVGPLTLVLPRSGIPDRSAPRARDSRHKVVCARPQAQIVGLSLLHPPIGGRPLAVKSSSSPWPPTASSRCHSAHHMACEPEGRREAVICAAGTSCGTLRRLPSSVRVLEGLPAAKAAAPQRLGSRQAFDIGGLNMRRRLRMHP